MSNRHPFPLETESGVRPRSAVTDRVLVGLAGIALVGGVLIAAGNVLRHDPKTASASVAPSTQSRAPEPLPTPRPLQVVNVEPGTPPFLPAQPVAFGGWVRATTDIVIHASPQPKAPAVGTLRRGDVAYAEQHAEVTADPQWLNVTEPQSGWIHDANQVVRYESSQFQVSGTISGIAAGPDGFVALGHPPDASDQNQSADPLFSGDGIGWRAESAVSSAVFGGWEASTMTWGPGGWLVAVNVRNGDQSQVWLWNSTDGLRWHPLGPLTGAGADVAYAKQVVASHAGYLLQTFGNGREGPITLWFSADGVRWQETADPGAVAAQGGWRSAIGIPDGFYTWSGTYDQGPAPSAPTSAAFSVDGQVWTAVENGPQGQNIQLIQVGNALLAIDLDPQNAAPRVWIGQFYRRQVAWQREAGEDVVFANAVVTSLVWDGRRAYAFGWDRPTEEPLVWTRNVLGWTRSSLPASFGGLPQYAAAGPTGVVVVGHRSTLRGDNPIVWHRSPTGNWLPEPQPVFAAVPNPTPASCPSVPRDLPALIVLDRAAALVCFGDAPMTMRAWSVGCDQCYGSGPGGAEPAWLAAPTNNQLFLAPIKPASTGEWWISLVLHPSVVADPALALGAWIELTGHFDDPAAATCHYEPALEELAYWSGQHSFIDNCRQTFVVTDVRAVSGP